MMTEEIKLRRDTGSTRGIAVECDGVWRGLCYVGNTTFTGAHRHLQRPYDVLCDEAHDLFLAAPALLAALKMIRREVTKDEIGPNEVRIIYEMADKAIGEAMQ